MADFLEKIKFVPKFFVKFPVSNFLIDNNLSRHINNFLNMIFLIRTRSKLIYLSLIFEISYHSFILANEKLNYTSLKIVFNLNFRFRRFWN